MTLAFVLALTLSSGCAYINTRTPLDTNLENTELGSKIGHSHNYSLLWLVAWGDGSYAAAARDGDIKVMKHSDQQTFVVLFGLFSKRTVIVYGD
jgi:hypothetical protein